MKMRVSDFPRGLLQPLHRFLEGSASTAMLTRNVSEGIHSEQRRNMVEDTSNQHDRRQVAALRIRRIGFFAESNEFDK